jgi:hypothetical protein
MLHISSIFFKKELELGSSGMARTQALRVQVVVVVEPRLPNTGHKDGCTETEAESSNGNNRTYFDVVGGQLCHDGGDSNEGIWMTEKGALF